MLKIGQTAEMEFETALDFLGGAGAEPTIDLSAGFAEKARPSFVATTFGLGLSP